MSKWAIINRVESFVSKKWVRTTCFYTVLFIMAVLTLRDILDLVDQYREDDKKTKMDIVFNDTITFPNMTFCMTKRQAFSHFNRSNNATEWDIAIKEGLDELKSKEAFLRRRWDFRMIAEAYQVVATLNSMEREMTDVGVLHSVTTYRLSPRLAQARKMIMFWLGEIEKRDVTFAEFLQKVGVETLKRSLDRFQRLSFDENEIFRTRIKITWISLLQLCFQPEFDAENFKDIDEQGEFFTVQLSHNAANMDQMMVDCVSLDMHGRPTDLARNMEGKGRIHDGVALELCLGQRHEVEVEIKARYISLEDLETDDGTACRNYDPNEDNEFDCRSRCRMKMIQKMCKCTPHTLQYLVDDAVLNEYPGCDYEKCTINLANATIADFVDEKCAEKCIASCVQTRYSVTAFNKGKATQPHLTQITVYWMSFEYLQMEQELAWTPATFFAALGGSLGLWLGLSILSTIQFLIFLSAHLSRRVAAKRLKKRDANSNANRNANSIREGGETMQMRENKISNETPNDSNLSNWQSKRK